jgi:hypothetical protein
VTTLAPFSSTTELTTLVLANCRGVTDAWLTALMTPKPNELLYASSDDEEMDEPRRQFMDAVSCSGSDSSTNSFVSATQHPPMIMDSATNPPERMIIATDDDDDKPHYYTTTPTATQQLTLLDLTAATHVTDQGLLQLTTHLHQLEEAVLDHCHSLAGSGLAILADSHRLHTLSLQHCRRLTDVCSIRHLASLESLNLHGCRCLTDRALAALVDVYTLRHLDCSQCDLLTDAGLEQLEALELLEDVSFSWCRGLTDRGFTGFSQHPGRAVHLRRLRVARCPIADVRWLHTLAALEELDVNGCAQVSSAVLGNAVKRLAHLTTLNVSYCSGIL